MKITGVFDGKGMTFDRGVQCSGQSEGDDSDAVFDIQEGGTLKNVIIGANQKEGVHCQGSCTLENVWWEAVCEDAFTIKKQTAGATTTITGGGASGAEDKVLQHNGGGTLKVSGFTVDNFGKLYRSCGNCKESAERHVILDGVKASGGTSTLSKISSRLRLDLRTDFRQLASTLTLATLLRSRTLASLVPRRFARNSRGQHQETSQSLSAKAPVILAYSLMQTSTLARVPCPSSCKTVRNILETRLSPRACARNLERSCC